MDHIVKTIADLEKKVAEHEADALRLKTTINELCSMAGLQPRYAASALQTNGARSYVIRSDQFHGRPTATCVREYLEMRKRADLGPASLNEIFDALLEGGYEFNTKSDQVSRVSLNNQISKNPIFYRLPNKQWGLLEWYPKARPQRPPQQQVEIPEEEKENFNRQMREQGLPEEQIT